MLNFETPFTDMFVAGVKRKLMSSKKPTVLHKETCPACGRKLVNLYLNSADNKYLCKKCIDDLHKDEV